MIEFKIMYLGHFTKEPTQRPLETSICGPVNWPMGILTFHIPLLLLNGWLSSCAPVDTRVSLCRRLVSKCRKAAQLSGAGRRYRNSRLLGPRKK